MSQERFKELSDKVQSFGKGGYMKLSKEEQTEYSTLKEQFKTLGTASEFEEGDEVVPTPKQEVPRETITMSRQELEDLIASKVANLQEANTALMVKTNEMRAEMGLGEWKSFEETQDRKHTAWLKVYRENPMDEGGVIVGSRENKITRDAKGYILNTLYQIDVLFKDGVKQFVIPQVEFGSITDREMVDIIEMKKEKKVKVHGKVRKSVKDKEGYSYSPLTSSDGSINQDKKGDEWVELREVRDEITVTIKRADGQTHRMNGKYLNS